MIIVTGGINKQKFSLILEPADWVLVISFLSLLIYGLAKQRPYIVRIERIEIILLLYLSCAFITPLFYHLGEGVNEYLFEYLIPVRLYVAYKVFYFLISESKIKFYSGLNIKNLIPVLLHVGLISAIISLINMSPYDIPFISEIVKDLWPLPRLKWYRLWGTNGGTNAAGNLFAVLIIFSGYYYFNINKNRLVFCYGVLFFICLLFSGSLSSFGAMIISLLLYQVIIEKKFPFNIKYTILSTLLVLSIVFSFQTVKTSIESRIQIQFYNYGKFNFLPFSLEDRIYWWKRQYEIISEENKMIFGYGPGGIRQSKQASKIDTGPESFYMTLLQNYGILAIIAFIALIIKVISKIRTHCFISKHFKVLYSVILFYPIAGIANVTFHYGAMIEIFALILSLLAVAPLGIGNEKKKDGHLLRPIINL
jgi:hypothetical protein